MLVLLCVCVCMCLCLCLCLCVQLCPAVCSPPLPSLFLSIPLFAPSSLPLLPLHLFSPLPSLSLPLTPVSLLLRSPYPRLPPLPSARGHHGPAWPAPRQHRLSLARLLHQHPQGNDKRLLHAGESAHACMHARVHVRVHVRVCVCVCSAVDFSCTFPTQTNHSPLPLLFSPFPPPPSPLFRNRLHTLSGLATT